MVYRDTRERGLQEFLSAEIVGREVSDHEFRCATGVSESRWNERRAQPDFPNPNELENVAEFFSLGRDGYADLLAEFGHIPLYLSRRVQAFTTALQRPPL